MIKRNEKKGVTELLAYVLLIGLAVSLSVIVYNWLRGYAILSPTRACPDGVSLIVDDYSCIGGVFNLTLRNKVLFNIDVYVLRINNETDFAGDPKGIPFILVDTVELNTSLRSGNTTSKAWAYQNNYVR